MEDAPILNNEQIDALKEVGTIGAGHAANALSQMTNKKIMISVPEVKAIPLKKTVELAGPPENLVASIYMKLMGDCQGTALLIFPRKSAFTLVDILMNRPAGQTKFLKEIDQSALKEVGNILAGSFLTALMEFLDISLIPSVPLIAYDMVGAILEAMAIEFGEDADYIICIQTEFIDPSLDIEGKFILIFDREPLSVIIEKIEKKIKEMKNK